MPARSQWEDFSHWLLGTPLPVVPVAVPPTHSERRRVLNIPRGRKGSRSRGQILSRGQIFC